MRIERPSIATAKDYYNHCAHLLGGEHGDLGDGSQRAPKLRAVAVAGYPRRHSSPVQHMPTASSVVGYGRESGEIEEGVLAGGWFTYTLNKHTF